MGGSSRVFALDTDIDGTVDLEVGASDKSITRRWFDPFGNARGTVPTWSSPHGFRNAPESPVTGLVPFGARDYDTALGRFLSVDPAGPGAEPQQRDGYAYGDDPVTDPWSPAPIGALGLHGSAG